MRHRDLIWLSVILAACFAGLTGALGGGRSHRPLALVFAAAMVLSLAAAWTLLRRVDETPVPVAETATDEGAWVCGECGHAQVPPPGWVPGEPVTSEAPQP